VDVFEQKRGLGGVVLAVALVARPFGRLISGRLIWLICIRREMSQNEMGILSFGRAGPFMTHGWPNKSRSRALSDNNQALLVGAARKIVISPQNLTIKNTPTAI